MAAASYSFIDIVALDAVRERFARGEALLLLSPDLSRVLWTNGSGAALFGGSDIDTLTDGPSPLGTVARRQVSCLSGFPAIGEDRPVAVRLASGMTSRIVPCRASAVPLADGAAAILLAAPTATTAPAETAGRAIEGIAQPGQFAAIVDGRGAVVAASEGIAGLQLAPRLLARLAAEAAKEPGRLVKRRIETGNRILPAGLVHLADDANLLIVVDEGFTELDADMLPPDEADAYETDGGEAVSVLAAAEAGAGLDIVLAEEPAETWYFNGKAADEAGDARLTEVQSGAPVRFSWRTDAGGRFTAVSPEFLDAVELTEREILGQHWRALADRFGFDRDGEVAALLDGRDTWSGSTVLWPLAFSPIAVPVDLAALPAYGRSRSFEGFRGFGVARLADALFRPEEDEAPGESRLSEAPDEPAPADDLPETTPEALSPGETAVSTAKEIPPPPSLKDHSDQVVRLLSEHRFAGNDKSSGNDKAPADKPAGGLSANERNAFQEIGKRLKEAVPAVAASAEAGSTDAIAEIPPRTGEPAGGAPPASETPAEDSGFGAFAVLEGFDAAADHEPEAPGTDRPDSAGPAEAASGFKASDGDAGIDAAAPEPDAPQYDASQDMESPEPIASEEPRSGLQETGPAREPDAALLEATAAAETEYAGSEPVDHGGAGPEGITDAAQPADAAPSEPLAGEAAAVDDFSHPPPESFPDGSETDDIGPAASAPLASQEAAAVGSDDPASPPSAADGAPPVPEAAEATTPLWERIEAAPSETVEGRQSEDEAAARLGIRAPGDGEEASAPDGGMSEAEPSGAAAVQGAEAETAQPAAEEASGSDHQGATATEAGEAASGEPAAAGLQLSAALAEAWPEWRAARENEPSAAEIRWPDTAASGAVAEPVSPYVPAGEGPAALEPDGAGAQAGVPADGAEREGHPAQASDTALLDHLPIPVLIHSGDRLHYANTEFLALSGNASLEAFEEAGGLSTLFSGVPEGTGENRRLRLRHAGGAEFPVETLLRTVPWKGAKALLLVLRRVEDETPPTGGPSSPPSGAPGGGAAGGPAESPSGGAPDGPEQRLAEMRAIVDTATDGVVLMAPDGIVRSISRPAEALFGLDSVQAAGKPFGALFAVESQRAVADYLDGLSDNGVASVLNDGREVIAREAGGGFIPLFMTIGTLPAGNGFCAVLRDITQWKRAEEELTQSRALAERASSHKTEFLARVSHEIRTPLNAIIGFSELMLDEKFGAIGSDRYRDYLRDINRSGNHVLALVNDLLDISKIEAGQQEMAYEAVSLNDALGESVATMQPQANRERVIIRSSLAAQLPEVVADHRSIRQIALNILSNAIRFTPAGGQVIVSTAQEASGDVVMRVRDNGIGMSQAEIEQALKPFKQINSLNRTRSDGTGLGLPLTKAMVEANRARFAIASTPGEGTLVEVLFPSTRVLA